MFVVKVTLEDGEGGTSTTRRLVLDDEPFSFGKLCGLIVNRFELKPDEVSRASLRYTDPDGDLISVNTDVELQDALSLLGNSEPPLLRMALKIGEAAVVGKASWVHALQQANDDADSVVLVSDGDDEAARAKEEERLRAEEEEEAKALAVAQEADEAQLALAAREAERAAEEELRLMQVEREREALEAKAQEEARARAEEEARKEEEERLRREMEASQQRLEEEVRMIKQEEEERQRMLQAKRQADEEERERQARIVICLNQAEDNAIYRIGQLVEMGCTEEQLKSIFSDRVIAMHSREASVSSASSASVESSKAPEPAPEPVAAQAPPQEEVPPTAVAVPAPEPEVLPVAEPVMPIVAQDVTAQPLPVAEPVEALDEASQDLAARLGDFYLLHNPAGLDKVPQLIKDFGSRIETLNTLLRTKYGADLSSVARDAQPAEAQHLEAPREEDAEAPSAPPVEESEAMKQLVGMGFGDRGTNQALLEKHEGDISKVITELVGA